MATTWEEMDAMLVVILRTAFDVTRKAAMTFAETENQEEVLTLEMMEM